MAIKITRWKPDTCGCVLEYQWDTSISEDSRTHSFYSVVSKCSLHQGLSDDEICYNHVNSENTTKNVVFNETIKILPRLAEVTIKDDESSVTNLKPGIRYDWEFVGENDKRSLKVDFTGGDLTDQEKADLVDAYSTLSKNVSFK